MTKVIPISLIEGLLTVQYTSLVQVFSSGFYCLPAIFIRPSFESVVFFIEGAIIGVLFHVLLYTLDDIKKQKLLVDGFLKKFSMCDFKQIEVDKYAQNGETILAEALRTPVELGTSKINIIIHRDIKIYCVKKGRSSIVPTQMATYEQHQLLPSYIFLRDEPHEITNLGRFFVFHEIAHASSRTAMARNFSESGWKLFLLPIPWAILNMDFSKNSIFSLVIYVLLIAIGFPLYKVLLENTRFYQEINADRYATRCLNPESRSKLYNYLMAAKALPIDKSLSLEHNNERSRLLMQDLKELINENGNRRITSIESVLNRPMNYLLFIYAVMVPVMGIFSRTPTPSIMCLNVIAIMVLFFVFGWKHDDKNKLQKELDGYLPNSSLELTR